MEALSKNGRDCSVEYIYDCPPNQDGAFCMVYLYNEDGDCESDYTDYFTIYPEDCPKEGVFDECGGLTSEAEDYVRNYVAQAEY